MANILLAIAGLSPQVITETLYALHQEGTRIDEIHVIATRIGCDRLNASLFTPIDGKFHAYLKEYCINPNSINFSPHTIHVLRDETGNPLNDIAGEEDNEILLKMCLELTHDFTRSEKDTLYFSIAGGRKTMSACLMVAAQMYGRPQDRIYHVLVSPEFESHEEFFYPPVKPVLLQLRDAQGQRIFKETSYAKVTLVPIPFISVRKSITDQRTGRVKTPEQLMRFLIKEKSHSLVVNLQQGKVIYKKKELKMMPSRLALYAFFIRRKLQCIKQQAGCRDCTDCYVDFQQISNEQQSITEFYKHLGGSAENKGICALEKDSLRAYVSKIRQDIQKSFGATAAEQLGVESVGKRPDTLYGIKMERRKMRLII